MNNEFAAIGLSLASCSVIAYIATKIIVLLAKTLKLILIILAVLAIAAFAADSILGMGYLDQMEGYFAPIRDWTASAFPKIASIPESDNGYISVIFSNAKTMAFGVVGLVLGSVVATINKKKKRT